MSQISIIDYVESVMSNVEAPNELKILLENELIRYLMEASENTSVDEVKNNLCSPEKFAEELTKKILTVNTEALKSGQSEWDHENCHRRRHHRYTGEFMQEHSNVNIKLLYIPLVQILSGTQRIIMPLDEDDYDD